MLMRHLVTLLLALVLARPGLASEIELKIDSVVEGGAVAVQAGFVVGETGAVVLEAAPGDYPLTLQTLQVFVAKISIFPGNTMVVRFHVWDNADTVGGVLAPGAPVYSSGDLVVTINAFNVHDVSAEDIVIPGGQFTVGVEIIDSATTSPILSPSLVTDDDGCQNGLNWVRETDGDWLNLCSFGVAGDLAIRATAQTGGSGQFIDLRNALAGNFAPHFAASGSLVGGEVAVFEFTNLPPGTIGPLWFSTNAINASFKQGILVPAPDFRLNLNTQAGSRTLNLDIPLGLPPSLSIYWQAWFLDAGGPAGVSSTNAIETILP